ncbi:MAG TPA: hypothetical protein VIP29_06130 [Nitrososphaeraceae archaeon]
MIYLDSEDSFYSEKVESNRVEPSKPTKKEDSIITNKMLILFGIVVIVKIAVLVLWPI